MEEEAIADVMNILEAEPSGDHGARSSGGQWEGERDERR